MGRFTLRLPKTLHDELEMRAAQEGVSLNQYVVYALTRQVATAYTVQVLPEENIRQQRTQYEKLLESLGQSSLAATKEFLLERESAELEEGLSGDMIARVETKITAAGMQKHNRERVKNG